MNLDFIMIHGYVLTEDGEIDPLLKLRMDYGIDAYRQEMGRHLIVAGKYGQRDKAYVESSGIPESRKMRDYLVQAGIAEKVIFEEGQGTNTFDCTQNAYNNIILPHGWTSGLIVTNEEHLKRLEEQSKKIFPSELQLRYDGPPMPEGPERDAFIAHEEKALLYTRSRTD